MSRLPTYIDETPDGMTVTITCPACGHQEKHAGPWGMDFIIERCDEDWNYYAPFLYCLRHDSPYPTEM